MSQNASRTFVGFGFGAIQAGLYLYEASRSGKFDRLVVAYRRPEVIARIRKAGGTFALNIAHQDGVEVAQVGPVEPLDVNVPADRERLVEAIAAAEEIATAVSSVQDYIGEGSSSIHQLLAEGLRRKAADGEPRALIYASENHTAAAELLEKSVLETLAEEECEAVSRRSCFVNTVIGKMSRTVDDPDELRELSLTPITPSDTRAFLVERYRHILISQVQFADGAPFERAFDFEEKADLTPFEEAKLYGHNATHALAAYLGERVGVTYVAELAEVPGFLLFLRAAALEESGAALIQKHGGSDPLFTVGGYEAFTENLLERMLNPYLKDTVARVGRDPRRKLGWNDRLVGTLRLVIRAGLPPHRHALGTAAALAKLAMKAEGLPSLWQDDEVSDAEQQVVLSFVEAGVDNLKAWQDAGYPPLEPFFQTRLRAQAMT